MENKNSSPAPNTVPYDVIPSDHPARTLVLCFDGTGDSFDADNSNVIQFFSTLQKDDRTQQMVYYQSGIGTYTTPQIATPMMAKLSKTLDMMIAWNLDAHVMDGYQFLMQNYTAGDKICIFGFSRGAYTARALAGMVHKVGLLPSCNHQQVPFAYKMFSRADAVGWAQSTAFKKAFSIDVDIEFIGVWDTVNSVGLIPHRLPFTSSNRSIKTFRHAVSLDEHRAKFKANLYQRATKQESTLGTQQGEMPKSTTAAIAAVPAGRGGGARGAHGTSLEEKLEGMVNGKGKSQDAHSHNGKKKLVEYEAAFDASEAEEADKTDVLEVWFAGCHCDIGGGSVGNESRHNLARIPLRWMIRQCFLANTGIRFHAPLLAALGLDPASLYPVVKPRPPPLYYTPPPPTSTSASPVSMKKRLIDTAKTLVNYAEDVVEDITGTGGGGAAAAPPVKVGYGGVTLESVRLEEEEDLEDALCPIYDQLKIALYWWMLEALPLKMRVQREEDDEWEREWTINCGRARIIPRQALDGVYVHRTVKIRLDAGDAVADGKKYVPKAKWNVDPKWAD